MSQPVSYLLDSRISTVMYSGTGTTFSIVSYNTARYHTTGRHNHVITTPIRAYTDPTNPAQEPAGPLTDKAKARAIILTNPAKKNCQARTVVCACPRPEELRTLTISRTPECPETRCSGAYFQQTKILWRPAFPNCPVRTEATRDLA